MQLNDIMEYVWLGVTILAAIVEAAVPALVSIWFVPGGLAALICALAGGSVGLQVTLFFVFSAAALAVTRPLYKKVRGRAPVSTNADRVLGREAVVTEAIDNLRALGRVDVLGASWAARAEEPEGKIPAGQTVQVVRIEGVKLVVRESPAPPPADR